MNHVIPFGNWCKLCIEQDVIKSINLSRSSYVGFAKSRFALLPRIWSFCAKFCRITTITYQSFPHSSSFIHRLSRRTVSFFHALKHPIQRKLWLEIISCLCQEDDDYYYYFHHYYNLLSDVKRSVAAWWSSLLRSFDYFSRQLTWLIDRNFVVIWVI